MNYVLFGEEEFLIEQRVVELCKQVLGSDYKMSMVSYDAMNTSMEVVLDDAMMLPFFSDKKVIVVNNPFFLTASLSGGPEFSEDLFLQYLGTDNEMCDLILVCPYSLDERRKLVKKVRGLCQVEEFKKLDAIELKRYVRKQLQKYQVNIQEKELEHLVLSLSGSLMSIRHELEKLQLFDGPITKEVIDALISRPLEDNVFELVNAVLARDLAKSMRIWQDFMILNKEPLQMIGALASQFRFCYQVSFLISQGMREDEMALELACKPYRITKTKQIIQRKTPEQFLDILSRLSTLDQNIKMGLVDKKQGFELFLIKTGMEDAYGIHR